MITYKEKASLLGRISVLLEIGYTLEEASLFLRKDEQTLRLISQHEKDVWDRDKIIHPNDPYYSLQRLGLINEFDFHSLGRSDTRGENAKDLSCYYFWEDKHEERDKYDDGYFLLSYIYRYSISSRRGNINPVEPTLGEPGLHTMFGIPMEEAFKDVVVVESDAHYVEIMKSASVFDQLCMAVIEHGILRATLSSDLKVLFNHLNRSQSNCWEQESFSKE